MTKTVPLGEICSMLSGFAWKSDKFKKKGAIPIIRIQNLGESRTDFVYWDDPYDSRFVIQNGEMLVSLSGSIKLDYWRHGPALLNQRIVRISPNTRVHEKWLYWIINNKLADIEKMGKLALVNNVSINDLKAIQIPLPSLDEQRRIAALLDRADALRQKDRQLLAHYDQLAQSLFLDLFGDPVRNEKGFEQVTIRDLVRDVKYGTSKPAEEGGAYPYLRMNNITYEGHWDFKDLKYINLAKNEESKYLLQEGDLVFNRTNSKELVGKTAVYKRGEPMAIAGYLIRSRTNEKAVPEYISAYLNSRHGKAKLKGMCKNIIGMANINAQEFQDIEILQPPLPLQNHFATLIEHIEKQKAVVRQQMAASEALFGRLLQESFG